ncbi:hypothetical protein OG884_09605 [Streptosporangium sp. NBC_01755]|uniref:hypothetical protein n=1 Tax=unclassified Streptosporangium TaxID=2632669 RepID=UPI002DD9F6E0|nr:MULTISPECIES: hypothetical protein [unclassified Streptosporangium]WSA26423.1 hypothetical protein OIE13_00510 [Streptosporangium sp. NBC_01810]WSD02147.1 hypothetical protein OG884_09605 [Streptosporangium sp. NBC_01755]
MLNGYRGIITATHPDRSVSVQWRRPGADGPALIVERGWIDRNGSSMKQSVWVPCTSCAGTGRQ